jgi:hypothetical protein
MHCKLPTSCAATVSFSRRPMLHGVQCLKNILLVSRRLDFAAYTIQIFSVRVYYKVMGTFLPLRLDKKNYCCLATGKVMKLFLFILRISVVKLIFFYSDKAAFKLTPIS